MAARDNTLLSRLGFKDVDKKNSKHDYAAKYLSQSSVIEHIVSSISHKSHYLKYKCINHGVSTNSNKCPMDTTSKDQCEMHEVSEPEITFDQIITVDTKQEVPLSKGTGQYKTTIGFMDAVINVAYSVTQKNKTRKSSNDDWVETLSTIVKNEVLFVEVKVNPTEIGDILRQIKLYREYLSSELSRNMWYLVTTFDINEEAQEQLLDEGIQWIKLGPKFDAWFNERTKSKGKPIMEL